MAMKHKYWLPRGGEEAQRLDYQHGLLTRTAGYVIHPSIRKRLGPNPRIADAGSGTGVWLRDVAQSLDNPELHAFDISNEQFEDLPDGKIRINFHLHSVKEPFASQFHGQFDLVHARFIATALQVQDYNSVLCNLMDLLKPGGAMQWQEAQFDKMGLYQPAPDYPTSVLKDTIFGLISNLGRERVSYPPENLARLFVEFGLIDVEEHVTSSDRYPEDRKVYSRHFVDTWRSGVRPQNRITAFGPSEPAIEKLYHQMDAEIEDGAYVRFDNHTIVGFKKVVDLEG